MECAIKAFILNNNLVQINKQQITAEKKIRMHMSMEQ